MQNEMYVPALMRRGITQTAPLRDLKRSDDFEKAGPVGAIEVALKPTPDASSPRWQRIWEWVLKTRVQKSRIPDEARETLALLPELEIHDEETPALYKVITTLWDNKIMLRSDIADWLEREFSEAFLTVGFGDHRQTDPLSTVA